MLQKYKLGEIEKQTLGTGHYLSPGGGGGGGGAEDLGGDQMVI